VALYFADTSFWIALSSKRDQYHRRAVAWNRFMVRTNGDLLTTEAVLWEWLNTCRSERHLGAIEKERSEHG
jgi:predicted nucleic acid-binding protein